MNFGRFGISVTDLFGGKHPAKIMFTAGSPTNPPHEKKGKSSIPNLHDYVPAVNLQGCSLWRDFFQFFHLSKKFCKNLRFERLTFSWTNRGVKIDWLIIKHHTGRHVDPSSWRSPPRSAPKKNIPFQNPPEPWAVGKPHPASLKAPVFGAWLQHPNVDPWEGYNPLIPTFS